MIYSFNKMKLKNNTLKHATLCTKYRKIPKVNPLILNTALKFIFIS